MRSFVRTAIAAFATIAAGVAPAMAERAHGLAMHGDLKYGPDFTHFDYANPDAPKGGTLRMVAIGGFDNLNPFIVKGSAAAGLGLMYATLLTNAGDEAFSEYGLIAESVETPPDRSWVSFTLRPEARFDDGQPVTVDDVIFSLDLLRDKGAPFYRFYYGSVAKAEKLDERTVKFTFAEGDNRELPLILGQLPILPKHYWADRTFEDATLEIPVGNGPYRVASFEPGRTITYARNPDWWGKDLPVSRGFYNFDAIQYDYFRDSTVALQAFKSGAFDVRFENAAKDWATAYDVPAVRDGRMIKRTFDTAMPSGMQGFAFNLRRSQFADPRVREALAQAFDFEWTNDTLFYGQYTRTKSYFDNSDLGSSGLPDEAELALLEPLRDQIPPQVFTGTYAPPTTTGTGGLRGNLRKAIALLKDAGWVVRDQKLVNAETGAPFTFEILLSQPIWERISLPYVENLKRLGIDATVRTVDSAQYEQRVTTFDFDMIVASWGQSLSPGNEQREFWGSMAADQDGSRNVTGIKNPAIDALIDAVIAAPDRAALITRTRALDRVLLWNHLVIPQWHLPYDRVAYWNKFGIPEKTPLGGANIMTWWYEASAAAKAVPDTSSAQ